VVAAPPPPEPGAPATDITSTPMAPPEPGATARVRYLRETPMPPMHFRVVEKGGPPPEGRVVLVDAPPPPLMHEDIPPHPPGPRHVWLEGHWRYYAGHYVWVGGHFELPPRTHARFVPPHWDQQGAAHLFVEGYWQVL